MSVTEIAETFEARNPPSNFYTGNPNPSLQNQSLYGSPSQSGSLYVGMPGNVSRGGYPFNPLQSPYGSPSPPGNPSLVTQVIPSGLPSFPLPPSQSMGPPHWGSKLAERSYSKSEKAFLIPCTLRVVNTQGFAETITLAKHMAQADQGSEFNMITSELVDELGLQQRSLSEVGFAEGCMTMKTADRRETTLYHYVCLELGVEDVWRSIYCFVAPQFREGRKRREFLSEESHILLGIPWLFDVNAVIRIREFKVEVGDPLIGESVKAITSPEHAFCRSHNLLMYRKDSLEADPMLQNLWSRVRQSCATEPVLNGNIGYGQPASASAAGGGPTSQQSATQGLTAGQPTTENSVSQEPTSNSRAPTHEVQSNEAQANGATANGGSATGVVTSGTTSPTGLNLREVWHDFAVSEFDISDVPSWGYFKNDGVPTASIHNQGVWVNLTEFISLLKADSILPAVDGRPKLDDGYFQMLTTWFPSTSAYPENADAILGMFLAAFFDPPTGAQILCE